MANKRAAKRSIDPDIFREYAKNNGMSLKEIAEKAGMNERTMQRCMHDGEMTVTMVVEVCSLLDQNADVLFGPDDSSRWNRLVSYLSGVERN